MIKHDLTCESTPTCEFFDFSNIFNFFFSFPPSIIYDFKFARGLSEASGCQECKRAFTDGRENVYEYAIFMKLATSVQAAGNPGGNGDVTVANPPARFQEYQFCSSRLRSSDGHFTVTVNLDEESHPPL